MSAHQASEATTGCSSGQAVEAAPPALPKSWRTAATMADTGFHSAIVCSTDGSVSDGTNAFDKNVSGKIVRNAKPWTASGERASSPSSVPNQIEQTANRM